MEEKLENVQKVMYQLLGGLFSHDLQRGTLNTHIDILCYGNSRDKKYGDDISKWTKYPTTRQGDSNENRIEALEAQMAAAGELLYNMTNKEIEVYEPMHSQITDFKYYEGGEDFYKKDSDSDEDEYDDDDTLVTTSSTDYDSMPELEPIYSSDRSESSIEKRRLNSFQLCGNE
jgi:hypothetical protein